MIDLTFYGVAGDSPKYQIIQEMKRNIPSFARLLGASESDLSSKYGVTNADMRTVLLNSVKNWSDSLAIASRSSLTLPQLD